jgi:ADP-ribosylation factor-like protein 3
VFGVWGETLDSNLARKTICSRDEQSMPGVLSLLKRLKRSAKESRILLLGLDNSGALLLKEQYINITTCCLFLKPFCHPLTFCPNRAGKTTVIKQLCGQDASSSQVSPTQGFNVKSIETDNCRLNMWDIGGQKSIRMYWRNYLDHTGKSTAFNV